MEWLTYTELLALLLSLFGISLLARSLVKTPSIVVLNLLTSVQALVIRPVAIHWNGGSEIYSSVYDPSVYARGWLAAALFYLTWAIGYGWGSGFGHQELLVKSFQRSSNRFLLQSLFIAVVISVFVGAMLAVAGTSFLIGNREGAIATVNPVLRYLYPFVMLLSALGGFYAIILMFIRRPFLGVALLVIFFFLTSLVGQRGFLITFALGAAGVIYIFIKRTLRQRTVLLATVALIISATALMREIIYTFMDLRPEKSESSAIQTYLRNPDGDYVEVWMVLLNYSGEHGQQLGRTILAAPATILPNDTRRSLGMLTGLDVLNNYYQPEAYWGLKFGFNVSLLQELFLNFGYYGLLLVPIAGYGCGRAVTRYYRRVSSGADPGAEFFLLFGIWTLSTSFAGLQWTLLSFVIYVIFQLLSMKRKKITGSLVSTPGSVPVAG